MGDSNDKPGDGGASGGGNPPAPPAKTTDERLAEIEANHKKALADLQTTQEELKRVGNLNAVLMQRMNKPADGDGGGMDANRTVPLKLRRDFSKMDPTADPATFAQEIVLETAEQVRSVIAEQQSVQSRNASLRTAFYNANKDLVGWERVVGSISDEVQAELQGLPFDQVSAEIAKRSREFIKSKGITPSDKSNDNLPDVIPPGGQNGGDEIRIKPPKGSNASEPFDPDKAYADDMKDYAQMRNKERSKEVASAKS